MTNHVAPPALIPAWVDGTLTPVEKLEVHRRGLRHKAVSVFILRDDQILLQRRALGKYHTPGLWANACCTHPNWGESPMDCAQRRLTEELGLQDISLHHRGQVEYSADVGGGLHEHEVVELFVGRINDHVQPVPNPQEVMDTDWMTLDGLRAQLAETPASFTPWLRIYLADHAGMIFDEPGK